MARSNQTTPEIVAKHRQFAWAFIPVMLLTGMASGFMYHIWTMPNVVDRDFPTLAIGAVLFLLWLWVVYTLDSYLKSVRLHKQNASPVKKRRH